MNDHTLFCTNPRNLRRIEIARKVAFMMAWHPRLGADAPIRHFVPKDVGKLIANQYLSSKSQITHSPHPLIVAKPSPNMAFVALDLQPKFVNNGKDLGLIPFAIIDKSLKSYGHFQIQTPLMRLPFTLQKRSVQEEIRHIQLELARPNEDQWFLDWLDNIDESMINGIFLVLPANLKRKYDKDRIPALYTSALKYHYDHETLTKSTQYPPKLNVRLPKTDGPFGWDKIAVYDNHRQRIGSFQDNFDRGVFERGAEIKVIMKHIGVWHVNNRFFNQFMLEQVLVIRSAQKVRDDAEATRQRFRFIIDEDDQRECMS